MAVVEDGKVFFAEGFDVANAETNAPVTGKTLFQIGSIAGLTAQEAAGKSYLDLINERVLAPLGMKNSTFRPIVAMTYPLAVGHAVKPGEKAQVVRSLSPDARLCPAETA